MKKLKKSIFSFFGILSILVFLLVGGENVFAEEVSPGPLPRVELTVNITDSGVPIPRAQLQTVSFQRAYYKLRTGEFTEEDINSSVWQTTFKDKDEIRIGAFTVGEGITHSHTDVVAIIELLFKGSYGFLGVINETGENYAGSPMHAPGNEGLNLSDNDGKAMATVRGGLTAIVLVNAEVSNGRLTKSSQLLGLVVIGDKNTTLSFDKAGYETSQIVVNMLDLGEEEKRNAKNYVVEYGEPVTFHIAINKSMLTQGATINISPQSNIVIESITMPAEQISAVPDSLELSYVVSADKLRGNSKEEVQAIISAEYVGKTLNYFKIDVPQSDEDIVLDVTAYLAPVVSKSVGSAKLKGKPFGSFSINAFANFNQSYSMKVSVKDKGRNRTESVQSPKLSTAGSNFVFVSKENLDFTIEAQYVLGKIIDGDKYIYTNEAEWVPFDEAKEEEFENSKLLQGGHEFYLGDTSREPLLDVPFYYWDSDGVLSTSINQSIINLRGLAQNQQYFLYQVRAPRGYEKNEEPYYFEAWSKDEILSNGTFAVNSSVAYAKIQEYGLNGAIPSYKAGTLEFNAVYVDAPYKQDNRGFFFIWISFIVIAILYLFIAIGVLTGAFEKIYKRMEPTLVKILKPLKVLNPLKLMKPLKLKTQKKAKQPKKEKKVKVKKERKVKPKKQRVKKEKKGLKHK